jgi:hypothetical protein
VREIDGGPLEGVRVYPNVKSSSVTFTDATGAYTLADVPGGLNFTKAGYEPAGVQISETASQVLTVDAKMQRTIFVTPGVELSGVISPDDVPFSAALGNGFDGKYSCSACKILTLLSAPSGSLHVRVHWTDSTPLSVWIGQYYGNLEASYIGQVGTHDFAFDLTTPTRMDTILIGVGDGHPRPDGPIPFQLTVSVQ